jgi:hypothetical protein
MIMLKKLLAASIIAITAYVITTRIPLSIFYL